MKQYKIGVFFEKGYLVSSQINLVTEDYKSTEFIFEFDIEEGRKVFELKKPDGSKYIKDIVNNKITLVDYDTELNEISLIPTAGTYEFEIVNYTEDSKLTLQEHGHFEVRGEIVEVNDSEVEKDTRLPILDSLINDVEGLKTDINSSVENATEQANYAKQQGDYAKEQAQIIIDANTTATKIINDFETNVSGYTKDFNTNAEGKLETYNQNDIDKTKAYNENTESKENSYNENASNKLKEYNDNATTKLSEYNSNSEAKTTAFNTNASEKTDAFNLNVTNKTTDFNSNAETKTTEFNDNATTKTEEYNTNAEAKVNEFNTNVDELKQDVEDCYNNMLTNEVEGTSIHVEDSANAKILSLESEGNCEQITTTGKNMFDKNSVTKKDGTVLNDTGVEAYSSNGGYIDGYIKVNPNTEYTLNGGITNGNPTGRIYTYTSDKVFISRELSFSSTPFTFTTPTDCEYISFQYQKNILNLDTIQLEESTVATEYEPYTQGQITPNPDYPQEIETVEAYNLFDKDNANILNLALDAGNGSILNNNNGRIFHIEIPTGTDSLTVSKIAGQRFAIGTTDSIPNIGSTCLNYVSNHTYTRLTIPVLSNSKYLVVFYYLASADTLTEQEILDSIQVVKGKEAKPYVPHGCIRSKFTGKNRIDTSKFVSKTGNGMTGSINNDTSIKFVGTSTALSNFWINDLNETLKAGTYRFVTNIDLTDKGTYVLYDNTSGSNVTINSCRKTGTFKLSKDMILTTVLIQINSGVTLKDDFYIMLVNENGTEEYETYKENDLDINLQDNFMAKIGDVADTLRVENCRAILTKRIGKAVLDGSEQWSYDQAYAIFSSNVLIGAKDDKEVINTLSDRFVSVSYNNRGGDFARIYANNSWVAIRGVKQTTVDEFKIWLQANPLTVYYVLTEPYEVDLGEVTMPKTYEGVTNISMIANLESNMKLKYARSTNVVVDNLAKAIVALGGEV